MQQVAADCAVEIGFVVVRENRRVAQRHVQDREARDVDAVERELYVVDEIDARRAADRNLPLGLQSQAAGSLRLEQHGRTGAGIEGEAQGRAVIDANPDDEMAVVPLEGNGNTLIARMPDVLRLGVALLHVLRGRRPRRVRHTQSTRRS